LSLVARPAYLWSPGLQQMHPLVVLPSLSLSLSLCVCVYVFVCLSAILSGLVLLITVTQCVCLCPICTVVGAACLTRCWRSAHWPSLVGILRHQQVPTWVRQAQQCLRQHARVACGLQQVS
jgi:hypothetical protein